MKANLISSERRKNKGNPLFLQARSEMKANLISSERLLKQRKF